MLNFTAMFRETSVEKLIEYIRTLPAGEQKAIAQKMHSSKKAGKATKERPSRKKVQDFISYTSKLPVRITADYKFDREEANER